MSGYFYLIRYFYQNQTKQETTILSTNNYKKKAALNVRYKQVIFPCMTSTNSIEKQIDCVHLW